MRSGIATAPQKGKPLCRLLLQSTQGSRHSRQRISTQTHYILWKHPNLETGAMPLSPTPIGTDIQDREYVLPRIPLPRTSVNKEKKSAVWTIVSARFLACLTQRTGGAAGTALAGEHGQGHQRARCSSQPQTDQGSVVQDQGTEPGS